LSAGEQGAFNPVGESDHTLPCGKRWETRGLSVSALAGIEAWITADAQGFFVVHHRDTEAQRKKQKRKNITSLLCASALKMPEKKNLTQRRGDAERKQGMLFSAPLRLCVRFNETCVFMFWRESKTHERLWWFLLYIFILGDHGDTDHH
jgi:hypothetical protein